MNQQQYCRPCTCAAPPVVDLTRAFLQRYHHHECHPPPINQQQHQENQQQQLLENLKSCGWSHLCLDLSSIMINISEQQIATATVTRSTTTTTASTHNHHSYPSILLLQNHGPNDWKKLLVHLFEQQEQRQNAAIVNNNSTVGTEGTAGTTVVVYRVAESGSPDAGMVEPKQSFEVQRCTCRRRRRHHCHCHDEELKEESNNVHEQLLQAWTDLFHQVACTLRQVLKFPKNVLLQEEPCRCCTGTTNTNQIEQDTDDHPSCSVDLLRAFYYETAASAASIVDQGSSSTTTATTTSTATGSACCGGSSSRRAFGSNEHTDWGSFTIVWQDDVEDCLQTYCHACDAWNNVQVAKSLKIHQQAPENNVDIDDDDDQGIVNQSQNTLYLVVHVGDVTSLAIGKQQEQPTTATSPTNTTTPSASRSQSNERANGNNILNNSNETHHDGANFGGALDDDTAKTVIWPSPRHRVCLPTAKQQRRASLVYFAYPPPELSIDSISQALREWYPHTMATTTTTTNCGLDSSGGGNGTTQQTTVAQSTLPQTAAAATTSHHWVPYQDYYLLKNQATAAQVDESNKNIVNAAQCQFEKIAALPLRTVLTEKWNQVQRGS